MSLLTRVLNSRSTTSLEIDAPAYRELKSRSLQDYFSDDPDSEDSLMEGVTLDERTLARFEHDFERLLLFRKEIQGFSRMRGFRIWWKQSRTVYLSRPVVRDYLNAKLTLGELLDDLQLHYMALDAKMRNSSRTVRLLRRVSKSRIVLTSGFLLALLASKSLEFLTSLMLLGPGVQMVNSYTQPVITPMAQTAQQKGAKDLAPLASGIQTWLTNREKLKEVRNELSDTTAALRGMDFKQMSPEEAKSKWAEFEQSYFSLFMRYNQTLPSHLRDGRGIFKDWMVFTPVGLASNLATFDSQYWIHQRELRQLQEKEEALGGELPPGDKKVKRRHQREMDASQSRIAATLAAWKLYEFMYPEVAAEPVSTKSRDQLKFSYKSFVKSMRFDLYVEQFASQMDSVLKQIDAEFLIQKKPA